MFDISHPCHCIGMSKIFHSIRLHQICSVVLLNMHLHFYMLKIQMNCKPRWTGHLLVPSNWQSVNPVTLQLCSQSIVEDAKPWSCQSFQKLKKKPILYAPRREVSLCFWKGSVVQPARGILIQNSLFTPRLGAFDGR